MNQNKESQKLIVEFKRSKKELLTRQKTNNRLVRQLSRVVKNNDHHRLENLHPKFFINRMKIQNALDKMVYINAVLTNNYPI